VLCCAVLCFAVLCCALLCCAVLCFAVLCCVVLCCAVLCSALMCCAVLCCAVLCCAACSFIASANFPPSLLLHTQGKAIPIKARTARSGFALYKRESKEDLFGPSDWSSLTATQQEDYNKRAYERKPSIEKTKK
jgi:hypothetical protein